jgi:excisionase family DNA binding protein
MIPAPQLDFFASLDFAGRTALSADEVAKKLGVTTRHILRLAEEGALPGIDLKGEKASRGLLRIPIESYREFILRRMTGPMRREFLGTLPKATLREMLGELKQLLAA